MSRSRNIKPGFFENEILAGMPYEHRLLFIGIWTMADREGRLEDRPTRIKMKLFAADSLDVNAGLQALHDAGFILRYEVGGKAFLQVLAWGKHQSPHFKEQKSTIPAPGMPEASTGLSNQHEEPKASGMPEASLTVAALIPDSLIPDSKEKTCRAEARRFAEFWEAYPRSEGKKPAQQVWKSKQLDAQADEIIADVRKRAAQHRAWREGYVPHAQKYLRNELWTDAIDGAAPRVAAANKPLPDDDDLSPTNFEWRRAG